MQNRIVKPGVFVRIKLADRLFGYGRFRSAPYASFYDFYSDDPLDDLDKIASQTLSFTVALDLSAPNDWKVIGYGPLKGWMKDPVVQFTQKLGDYRKCRIVDNNGNERSATPEECVGLERVAVWESRQVEQRLLDKYFVRSNQNVEHLRVRLNNLRKR